MIITSDNEPRVTLVPVPEGTCFRVWLEIYSFQIKKIFIEIEGGLHNDAKFINEKYCPKTDRPLHSCVDLSRSCCWPPGEPILKIPFRSETNLILN